MTAVETAPPQLSGLPEGRSPQARGWLLALAALALLAGSWLLMQGWMWILGSLIAGLLVARTRFIPHRALIGLFVAALLVAAPAVLLMVEDADVTWRLTPAEGNDDVAFEQGGLVYQLSGFVRDASTGQLAWTTDPLAPYGSARMGADGAVIGDTAIDPRGRQLFRSRSEWGQPVARNGFGPPSANTTVFAQPVDGDRSTTDGPDLRLTAVTDTGDVSWVRTLTDTTVVPDRTVASATTSLPLTLGVLRTNPAVLQVLDLQSGRTALELDGDHAAVAWGSQIATLRLGTDCTISLIDAGRLVERAPWADTCPRPSPTAPDDQIMIGAVGDTVYARADGKLVSVPRDHLADASDRVVLDDSDDDPTRIRQGLLVRHIPGADQGVNIETGQVVMSAPPGWSYDTGEHLVTEETFRPSWANPYRAGLTAAPSSLTTLTIRDPSSGKALHTWTGELDGGATVTATETGAFACSHAECLRWDPMR